jgi:SAM-dependent methyltransferase
VPTPSAYDRLGSLYDEWSRSVTEDIAFYVDVALKRSGRVLEVGCGSGRVAIPLALAGLEVVGIDSSPEMLRLAAEKAAVHGVSLELVRADMRAIPELGTFATAVIPFRALLHLRDDDERVAVLSRLRSLLEPGGALAFDVFHPDLLDIAETQDRWIEREPGILEHAHWDASARELELVVHARGVDASMRLWWAEPEDWRRLLEAAGFAVVEGFGWFDRRPLEPGSTDSVWIARGARHRQETVTTSTARTAGA